MAVTSKRLPGAMVLDRLDVEANAVDRATAFQAINHGGIARCCTGVKTCCKRVRALLSVLLQITFAEDCGRKHRLTRINSLTQKSPSPLGLITAF
ncbi:hypothetical protein EV13_2334 [Prochlorococcus sp. MIT 0702]|nr:hypothetical protein EV12_1946 [Prochlorococcus sp. MIT 0701]KGG26873.1 hypothetical protein EV13_2334 [Prochlorococcus sp. MIT 0702]KGG36149.1 hypothetical protein EV14_0558 [Prochlorococcus sp. MIT 0703]